MLVEIDLEDDRKMLINTDKVRKIYPTRTTWNWNCTSIVLDDDEEIVSVDSYETVSKKFMEK